MTEIHAEKVCLGQANGPEVELVVSGDSLYASYETPTGYTAIYDDALGLYCYAELKAGSFQSTGVSIADVPPPTLLPHLKESEEVRASKSARHAQQRSQQTHTTPFTSEQS
ncbi:MAG: hypothetical protein ACK40D_04370 [Cyanobacteriota bacterium]|jgi:hypothetical protein